MRIRGMRTGISFEVPASDRERLLAVVADRNSPQKHVWRARIFQWLGRHRRWTFHFTPSSASWINAGLNRPGIVGGCWV